MSDILDLAKKYKQFTKDRDWEQFHNHKDLALSLVLEASEVLEHFQWKATLEEINKYGEEHKDEIAQELADVGSYLFMLAYNLGIDLEEAMLKKMEHNAKKYPVDKAKGSSKKYTELQ